jgi:hypothetical protein
MSLLQQLKPEYRTAIIATRTYVEPPTNTPAHIKARMIASMTAYCEKRSLTPVENRNYFEAATRFAASRPVVKARQTAEKKITAAPATIDLRHGAIALRYKALNYEQIKRAVKFNYGVDTLNALNLAEIGKRLKG